jgi:PAS domain S-box-containing protein
MIIQDPFFWLSLVLTGIIVALGQQVSRLSTWRDACVKFKHYERLRDLEEMTHSSNDAIVGADPQGVVQTWNPGAERMTGYKASEMIGSRIDAMIPEQKKKESAEQFNRAKKGEHIVHESVRIRKNGNLVPVSVSLTPVLAPTGLVEWVWAIVRDISERWKMLELIKEKSVELERSNKDLESFAHAASHDLQEPARKVSTFAQLLSERAGSKLDAEDRRLLGVIEDAASRMQRMIADLLEYSSVSGPRLPLDRVPADRALSEALSMLELPIRESGARVTSGPLPEVRVDPEQLIRVFMNLVSNSVKFHGSEAPRIQIESHKVMDGRWEFSVRDNGIGFEQKDADRIFDMFERLHPRKAYPGTGVGLALVKRIVERNGGHIRAESKPGAGTTIYFDLPEAAAQSEPVRSGKGSSQPST